MGWVGCGGVGVGGWGGGLICRHLGLQLLALVGTRSARVIQLPSEPCCRVEARPRPELGQDLLGPPYALLQGRMHDLAEVRKRVLP